METSFVDVYTKAITRFDSPSITSAYNKSPILFFKIMYGYIDNAISMFVNPIEEIIKLNDYIDCEENSDTYIGDGTTKRFEFTSTPLGDSYFDCTVNGDYVDYEYDTVTNEIILKEAPKIDDIIIISWYFAGAFNTKLTRDEISILATLLVACWAEQEKNFQLDLRTIIGDKTYIITSSAKNSVGNKVDWFETLREKAEKDMNKFAWSSYMLKNKRGR